MNWKHNHSSNCMQPPITNILDLAAVIFVDLQNGRYRCVKCGNAPTIYNGLYTLGFVEAVSQTVDNVIIVKEGVYYE